MSKPGTEERRPDDVSGKNGKQYVAGRHGQVAVFALPWKWPTIDLALFPSLSSSPSACGCAVLCLRLANATSARTVTPVHSAVVVAEQPPSPRIDGDSGRQSLVCHAGRSPGKCAVEPSPAVRRSQAAIRTDASGPGRNAPASV